MTLIPSERGEHPAVKCLARLAGMVLLGRSGLAAAAHHAPGDDGRRRFVIVVMPHIGLLADGTVGHVLREGQDVPSTACGALVGLLAQMRAGQFTNALDWDDVEMSVVATILGRRLDHADGAAALDLWTLTDLARQTASAEIMRLAHELLEDEDTDVALFSGVLIHGPDGDRVHLAEASLWRGAERAPVALSLP